MAEDYKPSFQSYGSLTPDVSLQNKLLQNDLIKYSRLTKPDESKEDEIKNIDMKEILRDAKK